MTPPVEPLSLIIVAIMYLGDVAPSPPHATAWTR